MTKRKRKRRRRSARPVRRRGRRLEETFERADALIGNGRPQEAIDLLEPYLASHPREPELYYYLGYAHAQAGDLWEGLAAYERALDLGGDPNIGLPLGALYMEGELYVHALRAWRPALAQADGDPMVDQIRQTVQELEQGTVDMARALGLEPQQAEEGKYHMEVGLRALSERDYPAAIAGSRRAIALLGDWPPPHNNLALALFYDGQPEQAIATCRQIIERDEDNIQALSNAIRFLAWTGREQEARTLWDQLRGVTPRLPIERLKIAQAAADLGQDQEVYRVLNPSGGPPLNRAVHPRQVPEIERMLAIAEANTGRRRQAIRRLERLRGTVSGIEMYLDRMRAGKAGLGWAERFSYVSPRDLIPEREMEAFVNMVGGQDDLEEPTFRQQVARFVARYPQIVRAAEQLIWEIQLPEFGIPLLGAIATPAAHAALRRFALSQAGEDEARMQALSVLAQSGGLEIDEWVRMWLGGAWQQTRLQAYELVEGPAFEYTEQVADLLNQGVAAMQEGDDEQAERLYRQALALEPQARQAYNNLGVIYRQRGEDTRAREMFEAALEADPAYVYPRCTLVNDLIDAGDIEGATDMLEPLRDVTRMQPIEMSFYNYTRARIMIQEKKIKQARRALEAALQFTPDYEPAEELLEWVEMFDRVHRGFESFFERARSRDRAARVRLQGKLATPDPTLAQALPVYTKDALTGMARIVLWWGGWSALRKAELIEALVSGLQDRANLQKIVADLGEAERSALRHVLTSGGWMRWDDFDAAYDNDLEESRHWNFHVPETIMGHLRVRGLVVETTVDGELRVAIPVDLRAKLNEVLR